MEKSRKKGILSLVLGFCSLYLPFFNLLNAGLAIAFGIRARKTAGSNLGLIGIILGASTFMLQVTSIIISTSIIIFSVLGYFIALVVI